MLKVIQTSFIKMRFEKLQDIFQVIEQSNQLKMHFGANISENIQNIKVFTVRAEAGLMINDIESMRKNYA